MLAPWVLLSAKINEALASDPANQRYLESLGEICIKVESELPPINMSVSISGGQVSLSQSSFEEQRNDILIRGKTLDLAKLLFTPVDNPASLRKANIRVEGDVALLLELSQIVNKIEINWEALFADKIGETPAVIASRGIAHAKKASKQFLDAKTTVLETWLTGSDSPVATRAEYDQMKSRLRELQYKVDRVGALLQKQSANSAAEE